MKQFTQTGVRITAALGVAVTAIASCIALAPAATAADLTVGNIDGSQTGSIIIHKHESGSQTADGTPGGKTATGGTGVAGVLFTAYKFNDIDLTTNAGWDAVNSITVSADACGTDWATPAISGYTFANGVAASSVTDANGESTIANLSVGAYLVCETQAPSTVKKKAAPFLVTIPYPNNNDNAGSTADGSWLYNVNVYPKNTVIEYPTKGIEVTKNGLNTASQINFPVTVEVPSIASADQFSYFIVSDPLESQLTDGEVASVKTGDETVPAEYYEVTKASSSNNNTVSVGFTTAGLTYLKDKAGQTVTVTFTATAASLSSTGYIPNTAYFYVGTFTGDNPPTMPPTMPPTPPEETNKVVSAWGDARISKVDADNNNALVGAEFQVYNTTSDGDFKDSCDAADITGDPISVNGSDTFTSDSNGIVSIAGLFVDFKVLDSDATAVATDHTSRCYVLVETKAPAGYVLPTGNAVRTALKINAGQDPVIPRFPWWAVWITAGFVISGVYVWRTGYQTVPVAKGKTEETADDESDSGVTAAEKE